MKEIDNEESLERIFNDCVLLGFKYKFGNFVEFLYSYAHDNVGMVFSLIKDGILKAERGNGYIELIIGFSQYYRHLQQSVALRHLFFFSKILKIQVCS